MTTYYVDTASTGGDGTTQNTSGANAAFATVAAVNGASFSAGDSVLFKKGCAWREQLVPPSSGSAGNVITFGSYGTGASPIIDASNLITPGSSWTVVSSDAVAEEQTTAGVDSVGINKGDTNTEAQGITTGVDITVPYIDLWLKRQGTIAAGKIVRLQIWAATVNPLRISGTSPIASSNDVAADTMSTSYSFVRFTFSSPPTLSNGTYYVLFPYADYAPSDTNRVMWSVNTADPYRTGDVNAARINYLQGSPPTYQALSTGHDLTFKVYKTGSDTIWTASVTTEPKVVFFDGTKGSLVASQANCTAQYNWFWAANVLSVYSASDPDTAYTSPGIEVGARDTAISVGQNYITLTGLVARRGNSTTLGVILNTGTHNTIQSCDVNGGCHHGIASATTPTDTLIYNNTVHSNGTVGAGSGAIFFYKTAASAGHENTTRGNTIYSNTAFAVYVWDSYSIVESNTVYGNGNTGEMTTGIELYNGNNDGYGTNNIVRYNSVTGQISGSNNGEGIDCDNYSASNQVYYNLCFANDGPGITIWKSNGNYIYNNTCYGNCLNSGGALTTKAEIDIDADGTGETNNNVIKNNIAVATQASTFAVWVGPNSYNSTGLDISNNCWFTSAANWYFWNATGGNNLATWNALTGVGTDLNADPKFQVNGVDFRLQASSPCIDAGVDVGLTQDYAGNPVPRV